MGSPSPPGGPGLPGPRILRIGSRGSVLARWQAEHVRDRLGRLGHAATITIIVTTGDRILDRRLEAVGGKGAFLKEIEEGLLAGEVDLAVHSLKDVPTALPGGLVLGALLERGDPRDAFLSRTGLGFRALPPGARVGTTSLRRRAQVLAHRPDLEVRDLRGNVDTRIRKLREGEFDGILLALAGLSRLGRQAEAAEVFDPGFLLPAPGQGAIAIECRDSDAEVQAAVGPLHHPETARAVRAERALLAGLGGGCNVPLGAYAEPQGALLRLRALVARSDGGAILRGEGNGSDPEELGRRVAGELLRQGASALMTP